MYAVAWVHRYGKDSGNKPGSEKVLLSDAFKTEQAAVKLAKDRDRWHHKPFWESVIVSIVSLEEVERVYQKPGAVKPGISIFNR